jgi:hypothetical protein
MTKNDRAKQKRLLEGAEPKRARIKYAVELYAVIKGVRHDLLKEVVSAKLNFFECDAYKVK